MLSKELFENLVVPDWLISAIVGGIIGLVLTLLGVLIRNRRALLTYHVTHDRIGISTLDKIHGEVSVYVGGKKMQNLFMSNIWLVNRSMRDIEDLEVKVYRGNENMILMSEQTGIEDTVDILSHSTEYEEIKNQLLDSIVEIKN